jgi:hypothetical protein
MMEVGVLIDNNGQPFYWHQPRNRSIAALPDSLDLWKVIWHNRHRLAGFAHSHPGKGKPGPSYTDVTTFAAVEAALGRRCYQFPHSSIPLSWWIASDDHLIIVHWKGPGEHEYVERNSFKPKNTPKWVYELRRRSNYHG